MPVDGLYYLCCAHQALIDRALSRELPAKMAILAIKRNAQHIPWCAASERQEGFSGICFCVFLFFFVLFSLSPLVPWSPGPPVLWSPGPLVLQSSGPLVLRSSGPLGGKKQRKFPDLQK